MDLRFLSGQKCLGALVPYIIILRDRVELIVKRAFSLDKGFGG